MSEILPTNKNPGNPTLRRKNSRRATGAGPAAGGEVSDTVRLSNAAKAQTPKTGGTEIRHDLVNKFKGYLKDGSYTVKAEEIADKMVQKIRENKNRFMF